MLVKESLVKILEPYMECPNEIADRIMYESVYLGKTVYVVTQYTKRSKYEVLVAIVSTMRYNPRKGNKSFTVEGLWTNGNYYNGTFKLNSIGKTVFLNPLDAHRKCFDKNGGQSDG